MNTLKPYDFYEISPVAEHTDECGIRITEPYVSALEAATQVMGERSGTVYWTLYGHCPEGGVECIGDFADEEAALHTYSRITGRTQPETCGGWQGLPPTWGLPIAGCSA